MKCPMLSVSLTFSAIPFVLSALGTCGRVGPGDLLKLGAKSFGEYHQYLYNGLDLQTEEQRDICRKM